MITKERLELSKSMRKGFTLIEILIVVAIIAILASIVLVGLGPAQQAARDSSRIADLANVQDGLELYYNKCGYYPGATAATTCSASWGANNTWAGMSGALTGSALSITQVPQPVNTNYPYGYGSTAGTNYVVSATLENASNGVFTAAYTAAASSLVETGVTTCAAPIYCKSL